MTPARSLKILSLIHIGVAAAITLIISTVWNISLGASFALGALVMIANVLLLAWSWWRLFAKKSIAWTSSIIVIKYAVLLGSIFLLTRMSWFSSMAAGLGVASFVIAALALAVIVQKEETEKLEIN